MGGFFVVNTILRRERKKRFCHIRNSLYLCICKVDRFVMIATTRKNAKHMFSNTKPYNSFLLCFFMSNIKKVKV